MTKYILFDLDGTLTEPETGIVKCIEYSLKKLNFKSSSNHNFKKYIGPPLQIAFKEILQTDDETRIEKAVAFYRERFKEKGQYENEVYPGIHELLQTLADKEKKLFVATSKPEIFAKNILDHFSLSEYFSGIYGSQLNGTRSDKGELIEYLLKEEEIPSAESIMIGDRKHDIIGASRNNIISIGVLWGYGSLEELSSSRATYLCHKVSDIAKIVL